MAQTLRRIVGSTAFDTVIIAVILANAVVLGAARSEPTSSTRSRPRRSPSGSRCCARH